MLVLPPQRVLLELLGLGRWRWRLSDLGDQICRRRFRKAVNEDSNQRDLDEDVKSQAKAKQNTSTILEPQLLLILIVADTREVGFELEYRELEASVWIGSD